MKILKNKWVLGGLGVVLFLYLYRRFKGPSYAADKSGFLKNSQVLVGENLQKGAFGGLEVLKPTGVPVASYLGGGIVS